MHVINKLVASVVLAAALVAGAAFTAPLANASTIDWTLVGVTFDDGGTAFGTFSTDATTGNVTAFDISTTAGSTLGGALYNSTTSFTANNIFNSNSFFVCYSNCLTSFMELAFVNPLTSPGIDLLVLGNFPSDWLGSFELCGNACAPYRNVITGEAISGATPLPAALPLSRSSRQASARWACLAGAGSGRTLHSQPDQNT